MSWPVTVIVPLVERRRKFFERFVLPSIKANDPEKIKIVSDRDYPELMTTAQKRNFGLKHIDTPLVAFCDDDTILGADFLFRLAGPMDKDTSIDFAYANVMCIVFPFEGVVPGRVIRQRYGPPELEKVKRKPCIPIMSVWRREKFPGFDEEVVWLEDWDAVLTSMERGAKGLWVDEYLVHTYTIDTESKGVRLPERAFTQVMQKHGVH